MDWKCAKEILELLADGVDPTTGEVFPIDDSCNRPEVIRAVHTAIDALQLAIHKEETAKIPQPENAGKPWTKEEDDRLCAMFDQGYSRKQICAAFCRSEGGISSRLVRLGKIQERAEFRRIR